MGRNDDELEREGIAPLDDALNDDEGIVPPGDRPSDPLGRDEDRTAGRRRPVVPRLVAPGEGDLDDDEAAEIASLTDDFAGESAEEAAMHITDEP